MKKGEAEGALSDGRAAKKETSRASRRKNGFNEKLMRFQGFGRRTPGLVRRATNIVRAMKMSRKADNKRVGSHRRSGTLP